MSALAKSQAKRRTRRLYHSAKISDYRFRRVLWHFVRGHTATETARATRLSVNSVNELYGKIRTYFFEAGLFKDFYGGTGWAAYDPEQDKEFEQSLLAFHRRRLRSRRGVKTRPGQPDYHLAESWWRLDFAMILRERPSDAVYDMMIGQLLAVIRVAGPVGRRPANSTQLRRTLARLIDQRILWLQRNAASFATPALRAGLEDALRTVPPDLEDPK
jgi:hypothetical protein